LKKVNVYGGETGGFRRSFFVAFSQPFLGIGGPEMMRFSASTNLVRGILKSSVGFGKSRKPHPKQGAKCNGQAYHKRRSKISHPYDARSLLCRTVLGATLTNNLPAHGKKLPCGFAAG